MANDPDNIIIGPASVTIDGVAVGYTQGGVTLRKANEYVDVDADQAKGIVKKEITMEKLFVNFTMLESTLANMQKAMSERAADLWQGSALAFGSASPTIIEHTLVVTGDAPTASGFSTRTYTFTRAVHVDEVETMLGSRDTATVIPVGFELLKDQANGHRFGYVNSA